MDNQSLRPCPFCGSELVRIQVTTSQRVSGKYFQCVCKNCGGRARAYQAMSQEDEQEAILRAADGWNRRDGADAQYDTMVLDISEAASDAVMEKLMPNIVQAVNDAICNAPMPCIDEEDEENE